VPGPFISEIRRRRRYLIPTAVALVVAVGVVAFIILSNRSGDVHKGNEVEFQPPKPSKPKPDLGVDWPFYHRDLAHRAYLPVALRPPYRHKWKFHGKVLMEFPPIVVDGRLYFTRNDGKTFSLNASTGHVRWKKRVGALSASSPAYGDGRLFVTSLSGGASPGTVVALRARGGKTLWRRPLPSRCESSPIVNKGVVYVGSENGTLYALWARTGRIKWTYKASGAIKASPALSHGTLYFGAYGGRMYAVWARTGRERWSTGTSGRTFGLASGNFYSTPAVDFGRVYSGNTDSKVYSFSAKSGELAWSKSTGGYVYSSPAVASVEGTPPSVFVGSYDGNLYALDARTGSTRWTARAGGRISGGPVVIGKIVYYADLDSNTTYGVGVGTGKRLLTIDRGEYNPVISDGKRLYVTGHSTVTAYEPKR
jgi:outer membrane protein assembly factor BamB